MAQTPGHPCPACGTMVPTGQRFCTNCGTDNIAAQSANPSSQYGGAATTKSFNATGSTLCTGTECSTAIQSNVESATTTN